MKIETIRPSVVNPRSFLLNLLEDIRSLFPNNVLERDFAYIIGRYEKEGFPFLTYQMSNMGKSLERGLITGSFTLPEGWPRKSGTSLSRVFHTLFTCVFNDDGSLRDHEKSSAAVLTLRQIFLYWSRYDQGNMTSEDEVIDKFKHRISRHRNYLPTETAIPSGLLIGDVLSESRRLLHNVFDAKHSRTLKLRQFRKEPWGRHGPGAVAGKEKASEKWNFIRYRTTPDALFKRSEYDDRVVPTTDEIPQSRITCVPKDFRGPRIICIEPKEMQFAQQGLLQLLMTCVRDSSLSRRSINFHDVSGSRNLCFNIDYATIDLKDASDNISLNLVKWLLPPWLYRLLVRYRTPIVGGIRSGCFATMGSALCFPVQTLVFWAIAQATVNCSEKRYRYQKLRTRVFGDDMIVPTRSAYSVISVLEAIGLIVNRDKTCILTPARESCGAWIYAYHSVYCLRPKTHKLSSFRDWIGLCDQSEMFDLNGFRAVSAYLRTLAAEFYTPRQRWNRNLQRLELRIPFLSGKRQRLDGLNGLYAYFTGNNLSPYSTKGKIVWRWVDFSTKY